MDNDQDHFFEFSANLLVAMANPARIKILSQVIAFEISVGGLVQNSGLSQSAISQHLAKLRAAKLVKSRRDAQTVYYRCSSDAVRKILRTLEEIFTDEHEAPNTAPSTSLDTRL